MRLIQLNFADIGPFLGEHSIDFEHVGQAGLFLLEGPTGSGKSTIIDAVVFALYGGLAGSNGDDSRMASDHRSPSAVPYVDLTFEVSSGVYRVTRTPKYARPKERGAGMISVNATARLWRIPQLNEAPKRREDDLPGAEILAEKATDTGAEITRIMGLSREQFVQTAVLPQGEFAKFIHAKSEERKVLLQRIFATQHYFEMEAEFIAQGKAAEQRVAAAKTGIVDLTQRVVQASGAEGDTAAAFTRAATDLQFDDLENLCEAQQLTLAETAAAASERAESAQRALKAAHTTAHTAQQTLETFAQWQAALAADAALKLREPEITALRAVVQKARRAAQVAVAHKTAESAAAQCLGAHTTLVSQVEQHRAAGALVLGFKRPVALAALAGVLNAEVMTLDAATLEQSLHGLEAAGVELTQRIAEREHLVKLEAGLPPRRAQIAQREAAILALENDIMQRTEAFTARGAAKALLQNTLAAAAARAGELTAATVAQHEAQGLVDRVKSHAAYLPRIAAALTQRTETHNAAVAASNHATAQQQARLAGIAGELAAQLNPGEACAVCGSESHPHKAQIDAETVTAAMVAQAIAAQTQATAIAHTACENHERLISEAAVLLAALDGETEVTAAQKLAAATVLAHEATTAASQHKQTLVALEQHEAATQAAQTHLQAQHTELATQKAGVEALRKQIALDEAAVAGDVTMAEQQQHDATVQSRVAQLTSSCRNLVQALHAYATAIAQVQSQVAEQGFEGVAEALVSVLTPEQIGANEAQIREFEAASARVHAKLGEPQVQALAARVLKGITAGSADEAPLQGASEWEQHLRTQLVVDQELLTAAELAFKAESGAAATAIKTQSDTRGAVESLQHAMVTHQQIVLSTKAAIRMKRLAEAGDGNERSITLSTYVLMQQFERVIAAANSRLNGMLNGRYQVQRIEDKEGGSRAQKLGLGLTIVDAQTGKSRAPKSLSGGETFCVALAMALGLADTVSEAAGGVTLDSLFIDEGFGSLDLGSLEQVQHELDKLRAGGRCVGVVSHVEDMKQSISEKISVRRLDDGSSRVVVVA